MKLKLDENLPGRLVDSLIALGHDVDTALSEGLGGQRDTALWSAVQDSGRFLVTQDLDFSDIRHFAPGTHHGIILVRLSYPSRYRLVHRVLQIFRDYDVESWKGCFVVATDRKVRLRTPQT